jgi:hypothetical protein
MMSSIFWDITPCNPLKHNQCFGGMCRLHFKDQRIRQARNKPGISACHIAFTLVSYLAYSSALKMEATYSSETLVEFQRTTRRYIPEDITLISSCFLVSDLAVFMCVLFSIFPLTKHPNIIISNSVSIKIKTY